ncbi:hypothetical protein [Streptomyces montanisoli]|uniref:Transposase family protein n=1 Tax=Streptomyces montanisoli TaxID=2798581 RepID=A0A940RUD9_9ACTN|nr:hypothetical protein [Streptomyces montanisoli]MBP0457131.1 hypothetical protein [Streptomyces montanisoli]
MTPRPPASGVPVRSALRPEITPLSEEQRRRAHSVLRRHGAACPGCGNSRRLAIGDALHLGFLFLDEAPDAYMLAVTCPRRSCPARRSGIVLRGGEFL